ncbi:MAG: hypothetical protein JSR91_25250 [Proteobacteria bacterium]|nr:hypothetical protein [Pseudomonadota bacterium]
MDESAGIVRLSPLPTARLSVAPAGGTAVDNFAIAMVFGIVVGAGSSIFIAAPILLFLGEGRLRPAQVGPNRRADAVELDGAAS